MIKTQSYTVVIVGGGIVGLTAGCALAEAGIHVAIVEGKELDPHWEPHTYDLRVSAITRASQNIFRSLSVWQTIENFGVSPYSHMQVWDGSGSGKIHFDSTEIGEPDLGHIIENRMMQIALLQRFKNFSTATWLCPHRIVNLQVEEKNVTVELETGLHLHAALVIGADGAKSRVRELADLPLQQQDYHHHALIATVKTQYAHQYTARQRFLQSENSSGTLAFLPLRDPQICSIVWAMQPEKIEKLKQIDEKNFNVQLATAFDHVLGEVNVVSERATFPLFMRHAKDYVRDRIALIGDAAHTLHPLAGQGMNLGILDAACLAEILIQASEKKCDLGALSVLRRYQRWRKGHNFLMIQSMEFFKRLFGSAMPGIRPLRNIGLSIVNKITPLKSQLIRHAMGLNGDLPSAAQLNKS